MIKQLSLIAGAALFAVATPAIAKNEKGHGHGKHGTHAKHDAKHHGYRHDKRVRVYSYGYGKGGCPPGLRRKNDLCMPRGQYKRLYSRGQRYPGNYGAMWSYDQIPYDLRQRYDFDRSNRYYYGDGYLYQVDPRTLLIERVVHAILR